MLITVNNYLTYQPADQHNQKQIYLSSYAHYNHYIPQPKCRNNKQNELNNKVIP